MIALAFLAPAFPAPTAVAAGGEIVTEDWERGMGPWTVSGSGASLDCLVGNPGCSLRMDPPCCGQWTWVSRTLSVPLGGPSTFSFQFMGASTGGDTDSGVVLRFANGGYVLIDPSSMFNNGLRIISAGYGESTFWYWPSANVWYKVVVHVDPAARKVHAEARDAKTDKVIATSPVLGLPAGPLVASKVEVYGIFWGGGRTHFRYDNFGGGTASSEVALPGVSMTLAASPLAARPGEHVKGTLSIANPGTVARTFTLGATLPPGWTFPQEGTSITVPAGASARQDFLLGVPASAQWGATYAATLRATGPATLTAEQAVKIRAPYKPTLTASWDKDTGAFDVSARFLDARTGRFETSANIESQGYDVLGRAIWPDSGNVVAVGFLRPDGRDPTSFSGSVPLQLPARDLERVNRNPSAYRVEVAAVPYGGGLELVGGATVWTGGWGGGYVRGTVVDPAGNPWKDPADVSLFRYDDATGTLTGFVRTTPLETATGSFSVRSHDFGWGPSCERCVVVVSDSAGNVLGLTTARVASSRDVSVEIVAGRGVESYGARLSKAGELAIKSVFEDAYDLWRIADDTQRIQKLLGKLDKTLEIATYAGYGVSAANLAKHTVVPHGAGASADVDAAAARDEARRKASESLARLGDAGGDPAAARAGGEALLAASWASQASSLSGRGDAEIEALASRVGASAGRVAEEVLRNLPADGDKLRETMFFMGDNPGHVYHGNAFRASYDQIVEDYNAASAKDWGYPHSSDFDTRAWALALADFEEAMKGTKTRIEVAGYTAPGPDGVERLHPPFRMQLPLPGVVASFDEAKEKVAKGAALHTFGVGTSLGFKVMLLLGVLAPPLWISLAVNGGLAVVAYYGEAQQANGYQQLALKSAESIDAWSENSVGTAVAYHALVESLATESLAPRVYNARVKHAAHVTHAGGPLGASYTIERKDLAQAGVVSDRFEIAVRNDATYDGAPIGADVSIRIEPSVRNLVQQTGTTYLPCRDFAGGTSSGCRPGSTIPMASYSCSETKPSLTSIAPPTMLSYRLKPGETRTIGIPFVAMWDGKSCNQSGDKVPYSGFFTRKYTTLDYAIEVHSGRNVVASFALTVRGGPGTLPGLGAVEAPAGASGPSSLEETLALSSTSPTAARDVVVDAGTGRASFALLAPPEAEVALTVTDASGRAIGYDPETGEAARGLFGDVRFHAGQVRGVDLDDPAPGDYTVTARLLAGRGPVTPVTLLQETTPAGASSLVVLPGEARLALNATRSAGDVEVVVGEGSGLYPLREVWVNATAPKLGPTGPALPFASAAQVRLGTLEGGEAARATLRVAGCLVPPCRLESGAYRGTVTVSGLMGDGRRIETTLPLEVHVDFTPPKTVPQVSQGPSHLDARGLHVGPQTLLGFPATDDLSGVARSYAGEPDAWSLRSAPFALSGPSRVTKLVAWSVDRAGNGEAPPKELALRFDADAPVSTLAVGSPSAGSHVTSATPITLTATDPVVSDVASGVARIPCRILGPALPAYESPDCSGTFRLVGDDGAYVIERLAVDRVGNEERLQKVTLRLDNTRPNVEILAPARNSLSDEAHGVVAKRDSDGDGYPDSLERALGSDALAAISTPRGEQTLVNPRFDATLDAAPEGWSFGAADAAMRAALVAEGSPWSLDPPPDLLEATAPAVLDGVAAALAPAIEALLLGKKGTEDAIALAAGDAAALLAGSPPDPQREAALAQRIAADVQAFAGRHPPRPDPADPTAAARDAEAFADNLAARLALGVGLADAAQNDPSGSLEISGVGGTATVTQRLGSGPPRRGLEGASFDALADASVVAIEVRVEAESPESGRPVTFTATVPAAELRRDQWQRIELPASRFATEGPLVAVDLRETAVLKSFSLAVVVDTGGAPLSPDAASFDAAHARIDNVRLFSTAQDPVSEDEARAALAAVFDSAAAQARSDPRLAPLVGLLDRVGRREGIPIAAQVLLAAPPRTLPATLERWVEENLAAALETVNARTAETSDEMDAFLRPHVDRATRTVESAQRTADGRAAEAQAYLDSLTAYANSVLLPYVEETTGPTVSPLRDRVESIRVREDAGSPPPGTGVIAPLLTVVARAPDPVVNGVASGLGSAMLLVDGVPWPGEPVREGDLLAWTLDLSTLSAGSHALRVEIEDALGHADATELPFTLVATTAEGAAATVARVASGCDVACTGV